ncbi:MAG: ATP-dependent DNA ligase [Janthinobacterium lividum]
MARFAEVAGVAEALAGEGSRLKKRAAIAAAVSKLAGKGAGEAVTEAAVVDAGRFCLFLAGQPFPEADARKLNAGGAILSKALKAVSGATDAAMTAAYRRHGDLGAAAYDLLAPPYGKAAAEATITLSEVAQAFDTMATARTTAARSATVEALLRRATALEAKYLLKLMLGDMRIGVKQSLVEEGIAVAANVAVEAVRHAVMLEADLQRAVTRAFAGTLAEARLTLFHPLGFMLASPVETPEEAVERFTEKPKKVAAPKPPSKRKSKKKAAEEDEAAAFAELDAVPSVLPVNAGEAGLAEDVEFEAARADAAAAAELAAESQAGGVPAPIHAFLEDKFDGIRAQLHCGDPGQPGRVAIYSRSREDVTESFPEIEEAFRRIPPAMTGESGVIFDGEILGWDLAANKALPFAVLGQRIGRKRVADEMRRSVPVLFMAFDLMFAEGELLLPLPLRERRARLERIAAAMLPYTLASTTAPSKDEPQGDLFGIATGEVQHSEQSPPGDGVMAADGRVQRLKLSRAEMVESAEGVDQGYRDARARSNEGVMLKAAGSAYLPGRRGLAWLKLKRELATLDVVITGAEFGSGKRSQFLSDYTFAVRGPEGQLLNLGKAYQGVTDAEIAELTEWLKAHTLEDFGHFRTVEPIRVIEVAFNNIMRSDRHASGFALRFPRILRLRDDKPLSEIDTLARVGEVYGSQPDKPEQAEPQTSEGSEGEL